MSISAEQINIVLDYQLTRIKQLEKELITAIEQKEQTKRNEDRGKASLKKAHEDLKQTRKELLQTKKALRMLIASIKIEEEQKPSQST
jgi:hypothetical protein